jgi:hypothetical protein
MIAQHLVVGAGLIGQEHRQPMADRKPETRLAVIEEASLDPAVGTIGSMSRASSFGRQIGSKSTARSSIGTNSSGSAD